MIIGEWTSVGIGALCFMIGLRNVFHVELLRAEAGDIVLWRTRRVWYLLKKAGCASNVTEMQKKRKGDYVENLRCEASQVGIESTAWFATSAFFASIGSILVNLGNSG